MNAANDENFYQIRNRTLPIRSSITSIPNYPTKLVIFLTNASCYWQVRCFFNGKTIIRSLRTTSKKDAIRYAKDFYNTKICVASSQQNIGFTRTHSIEFTSSLLLQAEKARVDRGEVAKHSHTMLISRIRKHILPFFEKIAVEEIGYGQINNFFNYICALGYQPITLSQYLTALRKVLNIAHANRWIEQVPQFPKLRINSTPRGTFTVTEYLHLLRNAKQMRNLAPPTQKITHRNTRDGVFAHYANIAHEMSWLIRFMVNSFVRPVDIKLIQHKHVEIIRGEHCYLRLSLPETKRHKTQIITLPAAVHIYEQLTKYFSKQNLANKDNYLFLPKLEDRQSAIFLLEKMFKKIVQHSNLQIGNHGQKRTLYSLRHSAITFRLLYGQGIDLLTLARNARTSLEMVDKFYASELRAEMNVGMLHSRR